MDNVIKEQLRRIFPQIPEFSIEIYIEEAKRTANSGTVDILPLCIDLLLDRTQPTRNQATADQINDDVIFVGAKKVEGPWQGKTPSVVYIDDERVENLVTFYSEASKAIYGETARESVNLNEMSDDDRPTRADSPTSLLQFVKQMFPHVDCERIKALSSEGMNLNDIVNHLLENPELRSGRNATKSSSPAPTLAKEINYFKDYSSPVSYTYELQCLALLKNDFRKLYVADIRTALRKYNKHYAPTRKCLEESLLAMGHPVPFDNSTSGSDTSSCFSPPLVPFSDSSGLNSKSGTIHIFKLLGHKRNLVKLPGNLEKELVMEIEFLKKQKMLDEEKKDEIYATHLNEQQYEEEGQLIECGCCYGEFPFEDIVQCSDGHLFCRQCLQSYAKEVIFGSAIATANLHCMTDGCTRPFPFNQLSKCLSKEEIDKYQDRLQEDSLTKVDIPNLVHCPFCEFAAIVDESDKVFACLNPKCGKETCKDCQEEWKDHFGLKCSEVEKKAEVDLRLSYEERMTMAKVRKCPKCACQFMKSEGCNKMTCRCGQTMCYICRKAGINYGHFCRHPRDPGKKCGECTSCSLWSDPTEDEEMAVKQLQREAEAAKRKLCEDLISGTTAKKQKV